MKKRLSALILTILMLVSLLPTAALAADTGLPFTDVKSGKWYTKAVRYVYDDDLMDGTSATAFSPSKNATRAEVVMSLWRRDGKPDAVGKTFSDVMSDKTYATAVVWADNNGIVKGYGGGKFGPEDSVTREQLAVILYRYCSLKGYDLTLRSDMTKFSDGSTVSRYASAAMSWADAVGLIIGTSKTTTEPKAVATRAQLAMVLLRLNDWIAKQEAAKEVFYTVTFDLNYADKGVCETQQVKQGAQAEAPAQPTRTGYTFNGWYTEKTAGSKFDFAEAITADRTLYAHWTANSYTPSIPSYTVSFEMNGHGTQVTSQTVRSGNKATAPTTPTDEGYLFDGWFSDGETFLNEWDFAAYTVTADTILYAKWSRAYTVSFEMNGHGTQVTSQTVRSGNKATVPTDPTATGYDFDGWFKEIGCTNAWDFNTYTVTADTTLYAKWTQLHTVTFDMNNIGTQVDPKTVRHGEKITEPTAPSCGTCVFNGWYLDDGTFENQVNFATYTVTADVTLHAKWTNANVTSVDIGINATEAVMPGVGKTLYATIHTTGDTIGYSDTGKGAHYKWYRTDDTETTLSTGSTYTPGVADVGHTISVYVTVDGYTGYATKDTDAVEHTIKYVYAIDSDTKAHIYDSDLHKPEVGRELSVVVGTTAGEYTGLQWVDAGFGGTFKWNGASVGTTDATYTIRSTDTEYLSVEACKSNYTFERQEDAEWSVSYSPTYYTVTFNTGTYGPSVSRNETVPYNSKITGPSNPSTPGCSYDGNWYKESTCTTPWNFSTDTVTSDTTLYAKCAVLLVDVTATTSTYYKDEPVSYEVTIKNIGNTDFNGLTLTDNCGAYTYSGTCYPYKYVNGSVEYRINGVLQEDPTATASSELVINGIKIPEGGTTSVHYELMPTVYAPLEEGSSITNRVTASGTSLTETHDETSVSVSVGPRIVKIPPVKTPASGAPGVMDYTFSIQNVGNVAATATDNVTLEATLSPAYKSIKVTLGGTELAKDVDYTYDPATGELSVLSGVIQSVPAATFGRSGLGEVTVTPGTATVVVTDTATPRNITMTMSSTASAYYVGEAITYYVDITNTGATACDGMTLVSDLGKDASLNAPLTYKADSVTYEINGVAQPGGLTVTSASPLTITGINVPSGATVTVRYVAAVNEYAPLGIGSTIKNTAVLNSTITADKTLAVKEEPMITYLSPVVTGNTYTFNIQNFGNKGADVSDNVMVTYTFAAGTTITSVNVNGTPMSDTDYTHNTTTGEFATNVGEITVPAATFTEDPSTHKITVTPGVTTVTVTVTAGAPV